MSDQGPAGLAREGGIPAGAAGPVVLTLMGRIPSKKNRLRFGNGRSFLDKKTTAWIKAATLQLLMQRRNETPIAKTSRVACLFTYSDLRSKDTLNSANTVFDLLQSVGIIANDNWKVCPDINLKGAYEKGVDRCIVEIWQ